MRITVDLPGDIHEQVKSIARDTARSFSETAADLMRRGLGQAVVPAQLSRSEQTGLPVIQLGAVITTGNVRILEDDDL